MVNWSLTREELVIFFADQNNEATANHNRSLGAGGVWAECDIHKAAKEGNIEAVKQHIAAGTDVNAKDRKGRLLAYCYYHGHKEIGELLITNGADMNAKSGRKEWTPLYLAIFLNRWEFAELLIAKGADVNLSIKDGITPLHRAACKWGQKEIVELLIANGADVNVKTDKFGITPLDSAARGGQKEIAELLIAEDADVNAKDVKECTALHRAALYGYKEIAELLIAKGADLNAKKDDGLTPLDWAIREKNTETADLLRKHGGKSGAEFSIHAAAELGNIESVKQHLAAGADVNARDDDGFTPLHYVGGRMKLPSCLSPRVQM